MPRLRRIPELTNNEARDLQQWLFDLGRYLGWKDR